MAQYDISIMPLIEAADTFRSIAGDLSAVQARLYRMLSDLPGTMGKYRQQIATESAAIDDLCSHIRKLGIALLEITEIYLQAERMALSDGGDDNTARQPARQAPHIPQSPPILHRSNGVLLSGNLVMSDWLQLAVLKYQQSQ